MAPAYTENNETNNRENLLPGFATLTDCDKNDATPVEKQGSTIVPSNIQNMHLFRNLDAPVEEELSMLQQCLAEFKEMEQDVHGSLDFPSLERYISAPPKCPSLEKPVLEKRQSVNPANVRNYEEMRDHIRPRVDSDAEAHAKVARHSADQAVQDACKRLSFSIDQHSLVNLIPNENTPQKPALIETKNAKNSLKESQHIADSNTKWRSGRWKKDEHALFLQAIEKYPPGCQKRWLLISDIVKTRSPLQVRTHAQKYYIKLAKKEGTYVPPPSVVKLQQQAAARRAAQGIHKPGKGNAGSLTSPQKEQENRVVEINEMDVSRFDALGDFGITYTDADKDVTDDANNAMMMFSASAIL